MDELRAKLQDHQAFNNENTHLQKLATDYDFKVLFCPKYHCELNPIEGLWCYLKSYVRKNNDQDFSKLLDLIKDGLRLFKDKKLNIKLWNRFWVALDMYNNDSSYQEVLTKLFGAKSSSCPQTHKKNKDFNTKLNKET